MNVRDKLQEIFRRIVGDETIEISDEMTVGDIGGWDSIMYIDLILRIEKTFKIQFTIQEIVREKKMGGFIHMIEDKLQV